ncbi:ATP-dependent DNA helicase PIF1 [Elysia marginata]|uniref:ATP-dependent DNA helicase PIF1 n=1 Tax=Elysia marginata TaxID=1093978 RepID=A0AAV4JCS1_9GAST|nr:ATP-dependent DNA helicase PIF1 [Elysia marginata]
MSRLLWCVLHAWFWATICHVTVDGNVDFSDIKLTVSTLEDIREVLEDDAARRTLQSLCSSKDVSCEDRCARDSGKSSVPSKEANVSWLIIITSDSLLRPPQQSSSSSPSSSSLSISSLSSLSSSSSSSPSSAATLASSSTYLSFHKYLFDRDTHDAQNPGLQEEPTGVFPAELLNSIDISGVPPNTLTIRFGTPVIFLWSLHSPKRMNGTRCLAVPSKLLTEKSKRQTRLKDKQKTEMTPLRLFLDKGLELLISEEIEESYSKSESAHCSRLSLREVCFCDAQCLAYGDCCWDFHEFCPHEVQKLNESPLRHAQAECVGAYNYLVYKDGGASVSRGHGIATNLTIRDLEDSLRSGNVVVTDTDTGIQYKSAEDFASLNPGLEKQEAKRRLSYWTPKLMFLYLQGIEDLINLLKESTAILSDDVRLAFQPDGIASVARQCPLQNILTCPGAISFRLTNVSFVCESLPNATALWGQRSASMGTHIPGSTGLQRVDGDVADLIRDKARLATRTLFQVEQNKPQECSDRFFNPVSISKTYSFTTLLDLHNMERLRLVPELKSYKWRSIECKNAPAPEYQSPGTTGNHSSCQPNVVCNKGLLYVNGVCGHPAMMMLHVKSTNGENQISSKVKVVLKDLFDELSGSLNQPSKLVVYQHLNSCLISDPSENGSSSRQDYYGLYYVLEHQLEPSTTFHLPASKLIADALKHGNTKNLSPLQAEICFYVYWETPKSETLRKLLIERDNLLNDFGNGRMGLIDNAMRRGLCPQIPWPWRDNLIYDNPNVVCERLLTRPENAHVRSNISRHSQACLLLVSSLLLLLLFLV